MDYLEVFINIASAHRLEPNKNLKNKQFVKRTFATFLRQHFFNKLI